MVSFTGITAAAVAAVRPVDLTSSLPPALPKMGRADCLAAGPPEKHSG